MSAPHDSAERNAAGHTINENLTGAVVGKQQPARISFRTAALIVEGRNRLNAPGRFFLVVPLT